MKFMHVKERYEIEISENIEKPSDFIFSSRRMGFARYVTKESRQLVQELETLEEDK